MGTASQAAPWCWGSADELRTTRREHAPWTIIKSDDKKRARINCMLHLLNEVPHAERDTKVVNPPDPLIVGGVAQVLPHAEA